MSGRPGGRGLNEVKSKHWVRSPQIDRRQALIFGSLTPVTFSRNCSTDVWSYTCELVQPPVLHGDTTVIGTRGPRPIGSPLMNSLGVPVGGDGGIA